MQGGATGVFAAVALNLIGKTGTADYIVTGNYFYHATTFIDFCVLGSVYPINSIKLKCPER